MGFFQLQRLAFLQKIRKFKCTVFRKLRKPPFLVPFGPILDHFWPKTGHFRIFGEKAKSSLFSFFNTKNPKILMRGFSGKWARPDVRRRIQRSIDSVERPKIRQFRCTNLKKSGKNVIFKLF